MSRNRPSSVEELTREIQLLRDERSAPRHRPGSRPSDRQHGELVAFDMVLALIEHGREGLPYEAAATKQPPAAHPSTSPFSPWSL